MVAIPKFFKHPIISIGIPVSVTGYLVYTNVILTQAGKAYEIQDQTGKTYIVTGATEGIGKAITKELARKNARVFMACRDRTKCLEVRRDIVLGTSNREIYCRICDMSDFESIRRFAAKALKGKNAIDQIDGIVHNAATIEPKRMTNSNGIELSLATNHMGPFLLSALLLQKLLDQQKTSRIVFVNTNVATRDRIEIDLNLLNDALYTRKGKPDLRGKYYGGDAYIYSKALELCFAKELSERLKDSSISVLSADPGWTKTKLENKLTFNSWHKIAGLFLRRPSKAVKSILYALTEDEAKNGDFIGRDHKTQPWGDNAENSDLRKRIWLMSEKWTQLPEHMEKLKDELGLDKSYFEGGDKQPEPTSQKPWYSFWR